MAQSQATPPKVSSPVTNFLKDVVAGTVGGLAVVAVGHPFDTVKVRLQTQSSVNPIYSGPLDCVKKTIKWEGASGLYKGVYSPLVGQMFFRAALFSSFGAAKRWLATTPDGGTRTLTAADYYTAGAITGFTASFFEGPIDLFKSQVQVQIIRSKSNPDYKPPYTTMTDCVRQTLKANGLRGPFQGLGATMLRDTPAFGIYFGTFEVIKGALAEHQGVRREDLGALSVLSAAGVAGPLYWLAIFPVDVVKSSMQCDSIIKSERVYPTMIEATKKLWAEGGLPRFFKGFTPAILRATPANGIMLFTVDKMGAFLHGVH